jgi:hypothetical protein
VQERGGPAACLSAQRASNACIIIITIHKRQRQQQALDIFHLESKTIKNPGFAVFSPDCHVSPHSLFLTYIFWVAVIVGEQYFFRDLKDYY